jgi:hypothetical protein
VNDPTHETVKVAITKEAKVEMSGREVTPDELREELQRLKGVDGIVWLYDGAAKEGADLPEVQEARQAIDDLALPVQKFYDREFQEPRLTSDPEGPVSGKAFIFAGAALLLLALILPFLLLPGNIMGLIILGIGVWQAWRINRRPVIPISGPYQTGGPAPSVPTTPTWQG